MNCFYIICHIIKNYRRIIPHVSYSEMKTILKYPISFHEVLKYKYKFIPNLLLWLLSIIPLFMSLPVIWVAGRWKRVL